MDSLGSRGVYQLSIINYQLSVTKYQLPTAIDLQRWEMDCADSTRQKMALIYFYKKAIRL